MLNIIHIFGPNFLILTEFQERPGWKEEEEGKEASEKQENQERQLRQNRKKSQELKQAGGGENVADIWALLKVMSSFAILAMFSCYLPVRL